LRRNLDLKVSILTDALRGTRETPEPCCASLLAPLITEFGEERVEIRMFHTPNLTGLRKRVVPKRINEGWGLQHMKLYAVDDELIMSGYVNHMDCSGLHPNATLVQIFQPTTSPTGKTDITSFPLSPSPTTLSGSTKQFAS
jgi:hypothetical protein